MPILSQLYPTYGAALRALNDLEAAGIPAGDIALVSGEKGAGARTGPGVSEASKRAYAEGISRGGTLVSVRADDVQAGRVEAILRVEAARQAPRPGTPEAGRDDSVGEASAGQGSARPVSETALPPAASTAFQERVVEVRATGEEAVVSKEARVVEEIVIRKEAADRLEIVRDTVRETKLDIEDSTPPR